MYRKRISLQTNRLVYHFKIHKVSFSNSNHLWMCKHSILIPINQLVSQGVMCHMGSINLQISHSNMIDKARNSKLLIMAELLLPYHNKCKANSMLHLQSGIRLILLIIVRVSRYSRRKMMLDRIFKILSLLYWEVSRLIILINICKIKVAMEVFIHLINKIAIHR